MTLSRAKLRLVSNLTDDAGYAANSLVRENQEEIVDSGQIASTLSLYFDWPEFRSAMLPIPGNQESISCSLSYDADEREASEISVHTPSGQSLKAKLGDNLTIRFEVFRTCFEFCAIVSGLDGELTTIIEPPTKLLVFKKRRLPRLALDAHDRERVGPVTFQSTGTSILLKIEEMTLKSIKVSSSHPIPLGLGTIYFDMTPFQVECIRQDNLSAIIVLRFRNGQDAGHFFDIYRKVAYPSLTPKTSHSSKSLFELYRSTDYFSRFVNDKSPSDFYGELVETWESLGTELHESTADYVITDDNNQPTGASSVVRAFVADETPVWVFHQMCAKKEPDLLERSGHLYTWRAEYLAARTEELDVIGWFNGKSRWLERIYVKFWNLRKDAGTLIPVEVVRKPVQSIRFASNVHEECEVERYGSGTRLFYDRRGVFGGCQPRFLNASACLDAIINVSSSVPLDLEALNNAESCLFKDTDAAEVELTLPIGAGVEVQSGKIVPDVSRYFRFKKEAMTDFISCIEHSFAVTRRKLDGHRKTK